METYSKFTPKILKYDLQAEAYSPLIPGAATKLLTRIDCYESQFPNAVAFFGGVLRAHLNRHPLLEDWLLVVHYQFFYSGNNKTLEWFEARLDELSTLIGNDAWDRYFAEVIARTDCATTNDLLDRLYDIYLEIFGALYLGCKGWKVEFIPPSGTEKKPDIKGMREGRECVLECKFIHTSEKYETFSRRFDRAAHLCATPKPPLLLIEQCRFPCSTGIKSLSSKDCDLVKKFNKKIYDDRKATHTAIFDKEAFVYAYDLPAVLVPVDLQYEFAKKQGEGFAFSYLQRLLNQAALQLKKNRVHRL